MTIWTVLIYAFAAVLAIQRLLAMMTAQRRQSLKRQFEEELSRREKAAAASAKSTQPAPAQPNPKARTAA